MEMEKEDLEVNLKDEAQHLLEAIKAGDVDGFEHSLKDFLDKWDDTDEKEDYQEGPKSEAEESGTDDIMAAGKKAIPAEQAMRMGR